MNLITRIFTDNLMDPRSLDYSGLTWSYPLTTHDISGIPLGSGDSISSNVYKSMQIPVAKIIQGYGVGAQALDLLIYLHGTPGSAMGGTRALLWKPGTPNPATGTGKRVWVARNGIALLDCLPGSASGDTGASVFTLRVNDVPETLQLLIAQECRGVSMYLRNPRQTLIDNPNYFIQTEGVTP